MGAITSLENRRIDVAPGGEATCSVLVRNTGTVVDQFSVEVLGDAQAWAQAEPAAVNLLPNEESTVVIRFRPPRSSQVPAGLMPFGVRIASREDPVGSVVEEGALDIGAFTDIRAEIIPRRARGRRQARCDVAIDNLGNHPVGVEVEPVDPDQRLRFRPEHTALTLPPGTTTFLALVLRPDQGFLRGADKTYPYQVRIRGAGAEPTVVDGVMEQQPLLPKWLPLALGALLAALIALVVLWLTVFKPTIESSAREAAAREVEEVANTANQAQDTANKAAEALGIPTPEPAPETPGGGGGEATTTAPPTTAAPTTTTAPEAPAPPPPPESIDFRMTTGLDPSAPPDRPSEPPTGAIGTRFLIFEDGFPDPGRIAGRTLAVSDLVLQNPAGGQGLLQVLRVTSPPGAPLQTVTLLEVGLNNFRDLDYHYLQPLRFNPGERIALAVNCRNAPVDADSSDACTPSASFSGVLEGAPTPSPTPTPTEQPGAQGQGGGS